MARFGSGELHLSESSFPEQNERVIVFVPRLNPHGCSNYSCTIDVFTQKQNDSSTRKPLELTIRGAFHLAIAEAAGREFDGTLWARICKFETGEVMSTSKIKVVDEYNEPVTQRALGALDNLLSAIRE